jgi:hypothetical protein
MIRVLTCRGEVIVKRCGTVFGINPMCVRIEKKELGRKAKF